MLESHEIVVFQLNYFLFGMIKTFLKEKISSVLNSFEK